MTSPNISYPELLYSYKQPNILLIKRALTLGMNQVVVCLQCVMICMSKEARVKDCVYSASSNQYTPRFTGCSLIISCATEWSKLKSAIYYQWRPAFPQHVSQHLTTGIIYKTQRASMILEFRLRPPLPNPISLLYFLGKLIRYRQKYLHFPCYLSWKWVPVYSI